jgi:hypothetical protein
VCVCVCVWDSEAITPSKPTQRGSDQLKNAITRHQHTVGGWIGTLYTA